ncbi:MAG: hypothetical protein NVS3B12_22380 [Acidimicrobiales bacterium]
MTMRTRLTVASVAVAAVALTGCSRGPTVAIGDGRGSPFCTDVGNFRNEAASLEAAATQDLPALRAETSKARDQLAALQREANPADRVNNVAVKDDLQVTVNTYTALAAGLDSADPADPNSATRALAAVQDKQGATLTKATGRLDAYTKKVCGLSVTAPTSSTVGPAGTSGGSATTTGAPAVGPVVSAPTTVPGVTTTSTP